MDSSHSPRTKPLYRGTQIVWYILGLLETALAFRFVLKLLGANPEAGFTSFIYGVTSIFTAPFLSVFSLSRVEGGVFEKVVCLNGQHFSQCSFIGCSLSASSNYFLWESLFPQRKLQPN